jgi:alpha-1,2-mannosyltransferase
MQIWKPRVLLAFCAAGLLLLGILVYRNSPNGSDFSAYYIAGLRLQAGQGLYEQNNADNLYVYPPLFALLVLPLSYLPLASAASVWYLFGLLCLCLTLRILKQDLFSHVSSNSLFTPACLLALLFCGRFLINHLLRGQSNLLLLALIAWGTHLAMRNRLWGSAMAIALAGTLKPFTLLAALLCPYGVGIEAFGYYCWCCFWRFLT